MFLRLLIIETRKTLKHPGLWMGLAALLFMLGIFTLLSHLQTANGVRTASGGLERDLIDGLIFFNWLGVMVYAVTASVISAFDYPDRSIQLWLNRGVPRHMLLLARLTTILFFGFLMVCFAVISLLGLGAFSRLLVFGSVSTSNLDLSALLPAILRVFWSSTPYLALTVLLAVVSRSPLFAAGGTIVYGSVFEMIALQLGDKFPTLVHYLPAYLARVLQTFNVSLDRSASPLSPSAAIMPEARAILVIGVIFIALTTALFIIFSRQDLGG